MFVAAAPALREVTTAKSRPVAAWSEWPGARVSAMDSGKKSWKPQRKKKTYQKPTLIRFGRQRDLTAPGKSTSGEDASSSKKPQADG